MTDNEINVAVAECCGWRRCPCGTAGCFFQLGGDSGDVPDYCASRDAMACALETLNAGEWDCYCDNLHQICGLRELDYDDNHSHEEMRPLLCAAATQQAEAFLKAKGKWRDV